MKKSKGQRRREKIAQRIALQEEDERLGRRSPPIPTSLPPEERERRHYRFRRVASGARDLDGQPVNRQAAKGVTHRPKNSN
jgi:hypothetical protein